LLLADRNPEDNLKGMCGENIMHNFDLLSGLYLGEVAAEGGEREMC
jgi:hypothetical protein